MQQHRHLIIRATVRMPPKYVLDIKDWLEILVKSIHMKQLLPPFAVYCDKKGNRGMTAGVIIETSHIILHSWDEEEPYLLQLDVYSCKEFDVNIIIDMIRKQFGVISLTYKFLDRDYGLEILNQS